MFHVSPDSEDQVYSVWVSIGSETEAIALAHMVVNEALAACIKILPVRSVYRWAGELHSETEWQLIMKTRRGVLDRLCQRVKQLHPYTLPEWIVLPVVAGTPEYLEWIAEATKIPQ